MNIFLFIAIIHCTFCIHDATVHVVKENHLNTTASSKDSSKFDISEKCSNNEPVPKQPPKSVILLFADGFGPTSSTFARLTFQSEEGLQRARNFKLPLDTILKGTIRTISGDSLITDSAAGATAYASGCKTYNGAIGVDADGNAVGSLMEAAKAAGMSTGFVVTNKVTDATPASFFTHNESRENENEIAASLLGMDHLLGEPQADLIMGGGLCHFIPEGTIAKLENGRMVHSCRTDERNLIGEAVERFGFRTIYSKKQFDDWNPEEDGVERGGKGGRVLALLAGKQMAYDIDRRQGEGEPSLKEMLEKSLKFLHRKMQHTGRGFVLLVEGSRIDVAAHSNDSPAHYREIIAYNEAVQAALNYQNKYPHSTTVISLADHETGGLTLGMQHSNEDFADYMWNPEVIWRVQHSSYFLSHMLQRQYAEIAGKMGMEQYLKDSFFPKFLGITHPSNEEIQALLDAPTALAREFVINKIVNRRARVGWTTHGHSGVDVNLHASGDGSDKFVGNWENTEICQKIEELLGLDVSVVTKRLSQLKSQKGDTK